MGRKQISVLVGLLIQIERQTLGKSSEQMAIVNRGKESAEASQGAER